MVQKQAGHRYTLAHGEIDVVVQQLIYLDLSICLFLVPGAGLLTHDLS